MVNATVYSMYKEKTVKELLIYIDPLQLNLMQQLYN